MKITDLLAYESIELQARASSKKEVLDKAVDLMEKSGKIADMEAYRERVYAREKEGTTGIGMGIAIPHGKCKAVKEPGLAAMVIPEGADFESLDGEPVQLVLLIAAPDTEDDAHLQVLSKLSMLLVNPEFSEGLKAAKTKDEFIAVIEKAEAESDSEDKDATHTEKKILAVTACPTGIAHIYGG